MQCQHRLRTILKQTRASAGSRFSTYKQTNKHEQANKQTQVFALSYSLLNINKNLKENPTIYLPRGY